MKLKSTQLRRYNRVLHNGIEKTIECIAPAGVMFREDCPDENTFGQWVDLDEIEFIPLTDKYKLKLGFKLINRADYINTDFDRWVYFDFELEDDFYRCDNEIELKFVHDLQNLYFGLKKEDLQFAK